MPGDLFQPTMVVGSDSLISLDVTHVKNKKESCDEHAENGNVTSCLLNAIESGIEEAGLLCIPFVFYDVFTKLGLSMCDTEKEAKKN
jgi:hypothetical protein